MALFWRLLRAFLNRDRIKRDMQGFEQMRNNLLESKDERGFLEMKGFCEGIEYCIKGKWHDSRR